MDSLKAILVGLLSTVGHIANLKNGFCAERSRGVIPAAVGKPVKTAANF